MRRQGRIYGHNRDARGTMDETHSHHVLITRQQPGERSCSSEAIGGAHYGPVNVYLSQVPDATTADGSTPWYKIFADSWSSKGSSGDGDNWGTNDLNACCGRMDIPIPKDTPSGDYLLRSEVIALHTAGSSGGAQFYMSCYQITGEWNSPLPSLLWAY